MSHPSDGSNPYAQPGTELDAPPIERGEPNDRVTGDAPVGPSQLVTLFFEPSRFFSSGLAIDRQPVLGVALFVVALAATIDRIEQQILKARFDPRRMNTFLSELMSSWATYWALAIGLSIVLVWVPWVFAGWWYRKRLEWSGAEDVDPRLARVVYVWVALVAAAPLVLETLAQTFAFPSQQASDGSWVGMISLAFVFWSIVTSYRAATTAFPTAVRSRALVWFGILPAIAYLVVFGAAVAIFQAFGIAGE